MRDVQCQVTDEAEVLPYVQRTQTELPSCPIMAGTRLLTRAFNARPIHPAHPVTSISRPHQSPTGISRQFLPELLGVPPSLSTVYHSPEHDFWQMPIASESERATNNVRTEGTSPSFRTCPVPRILSSQLLSPASSFHPAFHSPSLSPRPHPFRLSCLLPRLATPHLLNFWL